MESGDQDGRWQEAWREEGAFGGERRQTEQDCDFLSGW